MNPLPPTEQDLRTALRSVVPEDLDVRDFRARLDRAIADQAPPAGDPTPGDDAADAPTLRSLSSSEASGRRRGARLGLAMTLAACVVAALGIGAAFLLSGQTHRRVPAPASVLTAPADVRSLLYPGTVVLGTYRGQGSTSIGIPSRTVPAHFGYAVYGTCSGPGHLRFGDATILDCSDPHAAFGSSGGGLGAGQLPIVTDPSTAWELTVVLAPDARTNGGVQGPVDNDMAGPDSVVRHSGRGSGTVPFTGDDVTGSPVGPTYRVRLVCHGSGVSLPGLSGDRAKGLYTKTCFAGREYSWTGVRLTPPASIHVEAAPTTTWTIVIESQ